MNVEKTQIKKIVVDCEVLDWYLKHGLKLEDIMINGNLHYEKKPWLKPYIDLKIRKRIETKASCDKF